MYSKRAIGVSLMVLFSGVANAASISYSNTIPYASTDWISSVSIPRFNPALGSLDSVTVSLVGKAGGSIRIESEDSAPAFVNSSIAVTVQLHRPDNTVLAEAIPEVGNADALSAFDGVLDFGGTSGRSYLDLADEVDSSIVLTPLSSDMPLFIGLGSVSFPVSAVGTATADGSGNLLAIFSAEAAADVTFTYQYTIPEPATVAMLGLVGLLVRRRR